MLKSDLRKKILFKRKKNFNRKLLISYERLLNIVKNFKVKKPTFGGYFPVNYEIDCLEVLKRLESKKFKISLPVIKKSNSMEFFKYSFKEPLKINKYGIPEPIKKKKLIPNILLVPLVAFDKNLYRIGYGGGYYDRYLAKLKKKKKFLSIGFAFSFQQIKKVPKEKFDRKLDFVITEKKTFK